MRAKIFPDHIKPMRTFGPFFAHYLDTHAVGPKYVKIVSFEINSYIFNHFIQNNKLVCNMFFKINWSMRQKCSKVPRALWTLPMMGEKLENKFSSLLFHIFFCTL
jgi:hypothetical protein